MLALWMESVGAKEPPEAEGLGLLQVASCGGEGACPESCGILQMQSSGWTAMFLSSGFLVPIFLLVFFPAHYWILSKPELQPQMSPLKRKDNPDANDDLKRTAINKSIIWVFFFFLLFPWKIMKIVFRLKFANAKNWMIKKNTFQFFLIICINLSYMKLCRSLWGDQRR